MATHTTSTGAISAEMKTYYDMVLLMRAVPNFIYAMFAQQRPIPQGEGKTIEFRRFGNLTAATTPLTEGSPPAGSDLSVTAITATLAQYGDFVRLTDFLEDTSIDPLVEETLEIQGDQSADTWDQVCRDTLAAGTTVQYAANRAGRGSITSSDKITSAEVHEMAVTLKNAKARKFNIPGYGMCYVAFVSPNVSHDLQQDSDWKAANRERNNADAVIMGVVGMLHGILFIETTNAKIFTGEGSGGIDVHGTIVLGQQAYGIPTLEGRALESIVKNRGSAGTADPLDQVSTVGWKSAFTCKRLNEAFMLRFESAVS